MLSGFSKCVNYTTQKIYFRNICKKCKHIIYKKWKQDPNKLLCIKINELKYRQSDKGKLTRQLYAKNYNKSEIGKLCRKKSKAKRKHKEFNAINDLTLQQWQGILIVQENTCNGCFVMFDINNLPQVDHIIPISRGGGLTKENVQALCRSCNSSKSNKTMEEYQEWKETINV